MDDEIRIHPLQTSGEMKQVDWAAEGADGDVDARPGLGVDRPAWEAVTVGIGTPAT